MDSNTFSDLIRGFFAGIIKFIYKFLSNAVDLMYDVTSLEFGLNDSAAKITEKLFNILVIFMVFKITLAFLNYLINPDIATDSNKGMQNVIKRVIISIIMLISINPLFSFLIDFQNDIINSDILTSIFGTTDKSNLLKLTTTYGDVQYAYGVQMNRDCDSNKYVYTFSKGDHVSLLLLKPFIQPYTADEINSEKYSANVAKMNEDEGYCGVTKDWMLSNELINVSTGDRKNIKEGFKQSVPGPNSAEGFMYKKYYAGENTDGNNTYIYDFNYFMAVVCGIVGLLIVISFCFDIVIRGCTLFLLKVIAPVPIISYVSPQGKSSEMMGSWLKKLGSVWASLFIRIISLNLGILMMGIACDELSTIEGTGIMQIIVVLGMLMFAKKLPSLLEELIPGLKLNGGFQLNPFKRISNDALGGNMVLGAGAGLAAAGMSGLTNGIQRAGQTVGNVRNAKGIRAKLNAAGSGLGRTLGSTVAGATRGGINAFGRTSKDGRIFSGAWNGYQTSMFSKLQREDNLRKAGLEDAGLADRARFAIGGVLSDAQRFTGTLNSGQREYLNAARQDEIIKSMEKDLANEKREKLEPLQTYSKYASRIKERIDNSKEVKDAKEDYDIAVASGNIDRIKEAKKFLDEKKASIADKLFRDDNEIKDLTSRMEKLRKENTILQAEQYDFMKKDKNGYNTFASGSIYNTQNVSNVIERNIESKDIYDVEGYKRGDSKVVSAVNDQYNNGIDLGSYKDNHNENSQAKLQNASRMNKDVQQPGFKPSSGPVQETAFDRYVGGHPGGHTSGHGGGPVPPPPPGGRNP